MAEVCTTEALQPRMGFEIGSGATHLSEVPVTVLERGTEGEEAKCPICGVEFIPRKRASNARPQKFCSRPCYWESLIGKPTPIKGKHHTPETRAVIKAKRALQVISHSEETRRKIGESHKGEKNYNYGKHLTKEHRKKIGKSLKESESHKKFLARLHASLVGKKKPPVPQNVRDQISNTLYGRYRGELNPQWKGGITPLMEQIRKCTKMVEWRNAVFARDNYCDQYTGEHSQMLEAHHIIPFSQIIKKNGVKSLEDAENCPELWDITNGISLSRENHKAYHNLWGWK